MKYTNDQLFNCVPNCTSIRQLLLALGLADRGGNYKTIIAKLKRLNIDTSHFTGKGHRKGQQYLSERTNYQDYLVYGSTVTSYRLKNVLLREGVFTRICSSCLGTEWMGHPIPLELDHIDGDNINNVLENLRLLCPNCHALTSTYRGKNQKRARS